MEKVSLIIPLYNAGAYFEEMLRSVLMQTYPNIQLLVVDDGSTDRSADIFYRYENELKGRLTEVLFFRHQCNKGAASAMNTALPYCTGEYLAWVDADDWMSENNITKKVQFLREHPGYAIMRCDGMQIDIRTGKKETLARACDKEVRCLFEDLLFSKTYCHCGCYLVRAEAFFSCYPQRQIPESRQGQNMQMLLPPLSLGECGYLDEVLYFYRIHGANHSQSFVTFPQRMERVDGFEKLQLEILPHCNCDREVYDRMIREYWSTERTNLRRQYLRAVRNTLQRKGKHEE